MADQERTLTLQFEGPIAESGRIPLAVLTEKLHAAQRALLNIGSSLRGGGRRGRWKAEIVQACELLFVEARPGSLEIVVAVPPPLALPLPGLEDLGARALERMGDTLAAFLNRDQAVIDSLYPDFGQRNRVLKSCLPLLPEEDGDYNMVLSTNGTSAKLSWNLRPFLTRLSHEEVVEGPEEAIRTLTGELFRIEISTGERHLGLLVNRRQIRCYYQADYEEVVRELVPGSLVEVEGRATLDRSGDVATIDEIWDARSVQLIPLYWRRIIYGGRVFRLRQPIQIRVNFHDDLWIHEYAPLRVLGYAPTRAESLQAFRIDFAAAWDLIAEERDDNLTADAQVLRQQLRNLIETVEPLA